MTFAIRLPLDDRCWMTKVGQRSIWVVMIVIAMVASSAAAETGLIRPTNLSDQAWERILEQLDRTDLKSYSATTESTKIFASTPGAAASFGWSTAADGDTVVVGAYGFVSYTGAAFVFERNQGGADNWGEVKKLLASDYSNYNHFGRSVSISGDTLVVGANGAGTGGAAYVFERNSGGADNWGEVALITGADQGASASFGFSVGASNDRIVVGAKGHNASNGAAYLFERNAGGVDSWGQVAKLTAGTAGTLEFGSAVAISGETVVVGAQNGNTAHVYERNQGGADSWGETATIAGSDTSTGDQFGGWVDISRDTVAVGAVWADNGGSSRGAVYVFERNNGGVDNWGEVAILSAEDAADHHQLGTRVSVDGDVIVTGAPQLDSQGAVYLFDRNAGGPDNWGQVARLAASDGAELEFGVAVSGATVILGASADSTMGFGAGAAYLFRRTGETWAEELKIDADDTAQGDSFGFSLAMDGDVAVVGAWRAGMEIGSAYVFERNQDGGDSWGQVAELTASDGAVYERFGFSVDISDDHVVVGAPGHGGGAYLGGAAYVYSRNHAGVDAWGEVAKLMAADVAVYDQFGWSVGIDHAVVVVGSNKGDGAVADSGSAYLYGRNQGGADAWGVITELIASDGAALDFFGEAVSVSGDVVGVGAVADESSTGAVYLYGRNNGGADLWGEIGKLTASDAASSDRFGHAVAIHGSAVLVGAPSAEAAYLFGRNIGGADAWGEFAILSPVDGQPGDGFGYSVSLDAEIAAVGANDGDGVTADRGVVYLFQRNVGGADNWGQLIKLQVADGAEDDSFGHAVAISDHRLWAGAPYDDDVIADSGAAYRFDIQAIVPEADLWVTVDDGTETPVPGLTTTYVIQAGNFGGFDATGAQVTDLFPTGLTCSWTCVATGAASCTAGPVAGNIDDLIDLPIGETVTYTAVCDIDPSATGSSSNTTAVVAPIATPDPNPANDSDTDLNTFDPQTDLSIAMSNPVGPAVLGELVTYDIVVSNPGPSTVPAAVVTDLFPAELTGVWWTCLGSDGGSCNTSGSGDIDETVDLPVGGSVTFVANGTCDPAATGQYLVNTASVSSPAGVTEIDPADNTATHTDEIAAPGDLIFIDGFEDGNTWAWD